MCQVSCFYHKVQNSFTYLLDYQDCIQVLLLTLHRKNLPPLLCRFQSGTSSNISLSVASSYYEIDKKYSNKRYGMFIASCALPKELIGTPCYVDISINLTSEQLYSRPGLRMSNVPQIQLILKEENTAFVFLLCTVTYR